VNPHWGKEKGNSKVPIGKSLRLCTTKEKTFTRQKEVSKKSAKQVRTVCRKPEQPHQQKTTDCQGVGLACKTDVGKLGSSENHPRLGRKGRKHFQAATKTRLLAKENGVFPLFLKQGEKARGR